MNSQQLTMSCEEVDELAGAFAVDALPLDEREAAVRHLAACHASDHAELRNLTETAGLLAFTVAPAPPPADLGARILAAAGTRSDQPSQPNAIPQAPLHNVIWLRPSLAFALAAAAMFLIAIGLGAWGTSQRNALVAERRVEQQRSALLALLSSAELVVQTPAAANLPPALLVQPKAGTSAYLLQDWPAAPSGKTYQAWYIRAGAPASAGTFGAGEGAPSAVQLSGPVTGSQAFAVTIEPSGGSGQPTSQPLFVRSLTSS
jgi:anti-sigma-K factor RskA